MQLLDELREPGDAQPKRRPKGGGTLLARAGEGAFQSAPSTTASASQTRVRGRSSRRIGRPRRWLERPSLGPSQHALRTCGSAPVRPATLCRARLRPSRPLGCIKPLDNHMGYVTWRRESSHGTK
jgi:hypothetical protein